MRWGAGPSCFNELWNPGSLLRAEQKRSTAPVPLLETDDQGQYPESDASLRDVITRWKNKCTNPEYDGLHDE